MSQIVKDTPEALAQAYVWWQPLDRTLRDPEQILRMGTPGDYQSACAIWGEDAFKAALVSAPPGALDERSWVFWHRCYRLEMTPVPRRRFA